MIHTGWLTITNKTAQYIWLRSHAPLSSVHAYKAEVHEQVMTGPRTCVYENSIALTQPINAFLCVAFTLFMYELLFVTCDIIHQFYKPVLYTWLLVCRPFPLSIVRCRSRGRGIPIDPAHITMRGSYCDFTITMWGHDDCT